MAVTSLVVQMVKNVPTVWETWALSLVWEDPLEKRNAIHSSILAWRLPWTEEPSRLQSRGSLGVGHDWVTNTLESSRELSKSSKVPGYSPVQVNQISRGWTQTSVFWKIDHWFSLGRPRWELLPQNLSSKAPHLHRYMADLPRAFAYDIWLLAIGFSYIDLIIFNLIKWECFKSRNYVLTRFKGQETRKSILNLGRFQKNIYHTEMYTSILRCILMSFHHYETAYSTIIDKVPYLLPCYFKFWSIIISTTN